ncbi:MAG: hypothetical protein ACREF6_07745 [Alphaproteobacteria bacterium]
MPLPAIGVWCGPAGTTAPPANAEIENCEDPLSAMDATNTRRLIKKMLDSRGLMPETREELADYISDIDKGELRPDDAAYVEGLARRLGLAAGGAPANPHAADAVGDDLDDDLDEDFPGGDDADFGDTAAAAQAEIALRAIEQARALLARLREPKAEEAGSGAQADTATLDEIEKALGDAAEALTPRG